MNPSELHALIAPLWTKRPDLRDGSPIACGVPSYSPGFYFQHELVSPWVPADVAAAALTGFLVERLPPGKCLYRAEAHWWEVCEAACGEDDGYCLSTIIDGPTALSALVAFHMQEPAP